MIGNIWISSKRLQYWLWLPTITISTLSYKDTFPGLHSCSYIHVLYRWGGQRHLLRLPLTDNFFLDTLGNLKCKSVFLRQNIVWRLHFQKKIHQISDLLFLKAAIYKSRDFTRAADGENTFLTHLSSVWWDEFFCSPLKYPPNTILALFPKAEIGYEVGGFFSISFCMVFEVTKKKSLSCISNATNTCQLSYILDIYTHMFTYTHTPTHICRCIR